MNEADNSPEMTVVMDHEAIDAALRRIAQEIVADSEALSDVALLGILSRGRPLAERLAACIEGLTGTRPRVGSLATTLYRDDLRSGVGRLKPGVAETYFEFPINGATVILVDDVIAAGRTIRAALDELMDYGRPRRIQLACLVDRGGRELPIQPDYLGWPVSAGENDRVVVRLAETDGQDMVVIRRSLPEDGEAEEG